MAVGVDDLGHEIRVDLVFIAILPDVAQGVDFADQVGAFVVGVGGDPRVGVGREGEVQLKPAFQPGEVFFGRPPLRPFCLAAVTL